MKIREIKKLKRLYKVTLDDFISFEVADEPMDKLYVTEDTIVKFMLSKGADYSANELHNIWTYANYSRGKNLAIYYLSFKSRTAHEVEQYLREHEIPASDVPRILNELSQLGLIDDEAYTLRAIESALLAKKSGPYVIKQKLMQRGISTDLIDSKLSQFYDEQQQLEIATSLAQKQANAKSYRLPIKMLKQKIQQSLVTKGFSFSITEQVISQLMLEKDEANEQSLISREAEKAYDRLSRKYEGYDLRNRLSQTLARKGFDWDDISSVLSDFEF